MTSSHKTSEFTHAVPSSHRLSACVPGAAQDCYLAYALTEMAGSTVMIFTRTCESTRKIALTLRNLGFGAIPIHGQMSQPKRLGALNKFKVTQLASNPVGTWAWLPFRSV